MAELGVSKKVRYVVKPAEETWNGILPLSELDQVGVITHGSFVYISQKPTTSSKLTVTKFRESLSSALVPFYPLAGRLRWAGGAGSSSHLRLEVDCNGSGAELIMAESTRQISEFGSNIYSCGHKSMLFKEILPEIEYENKLIEELPILVVQLTQFGCGGFGLGIMLSHVVADGLSYLQFAMEWALLALTIDHDQHIHVPITSEAKPIFDRGILLQKRPHNNNKTNSTTKFNIVEDAKAFSSLPVLIGEESSVKESGKETISTVLPLTKSQVDRLMKVGNANHGNKGGGQRPFSRFEIIAAHIWRCASKARQHSSQQPTALCFVVDFRRRLDPPLPSRYFGNGIIDMLTYNRAGELTTRPLSDACSKIREEIEKVNNEYVYSAIDYLKTLQDLSQYQNLDGGGYIGNPNISIVSWLNFPLHDADFDRGRLSYLGPGSHACDGDVFLMPSWRNDGSVLVDVCLQVEHMDEFKKCLYQDIGQFEPISKI